MVIFGTGVVTGGLLVQYAPSARHPRLPHGAAALRPAPPLSPVGLRLDLLRHLGQELNLTAEQHQRIDVLLHQSQERTKKLMEPVRPQLQEEVQKTKQAFRELLTAEQQARFDVLLKQQQQQQRAREPRRPQPAPPPPAENAPPRTNS